MTQRQRAHRSIGAATHCAPPLTLAAAAAAAAAADDDDDDDDDDDAGRWCATTSRIADATDAGGGGWRDEWKRLDGSDDAADSGDVADDAASPVKRPSASSYEAAVVTWVREVVRAYAATCV